MRAPVQRVLGGVAQSVAAALLATLLAVALTTLLGKDPTLVLRDLATGAIASPYRFAEALARACPLMLCGLAVAVAFRCQAWNIGVEGQYLLGAVAATVLGLVGAALPGVVLVPAILVASAVAGALYAAPAALLERWRGVPLVLTTILLNFVARSLVEYLTQGPLRGSDPSAAQSDPIAPHAQLAPLLARTDLHWGFLLALAAGVALWILLRWTVAGFRMRVAGANPIAAGWSGIRVPAVKFRVICLSGAVGGLAGGIQVAGVHHVLNIGASEGFGYVGIVVALLGRLHPLGVMVAAVAIGMLDMGAMQLERDPAIGIPSEVSQVIKGLVVLSVLVLTGPRVRRWMDRRGTLRGLPLPATPLGESAAPAASTGGGAS